MFYPFLLSRYNIKQRIQNTICDVVFQPTSCIDKRFSMYVSGISPVLRTTIQLLPVDSFKTSKISPILKDISFEASAVKSNFTTTLRSSVAFVIGGGGADCLRGCSSALTSYSSLAATTLILRVSNSATQQLFFLNFGCLSSKASFGSSLRSFHLILRASVKGCNRRGRLV